MLAIDDVQWADEDSLLLLTELLGASLRNVLVLVALRSDDAVERAELPLPAAGRCLITLRALPSSVVESLVEEVSGRAPDSDAVAAEVYRRTAGNPLQIAQLLRLAHHRACSPSPRTACRAGTCPLLPRCRSTAPRTTSSEARPRGCGDRRRHGLLGGEFVLADVVTATALPPETVGRAMWSALDLRLVDAVDRAGRRMPPVIDHAVRYRVGHDRVAEVAAARLPADVVRTVHRRIGMSLAERGADRLFDAARHLALAGVDEGGVDTDRFANVQLRAARLARLLASYPVALDCYRAGLRLLGDRRWTDHAELTRELHLGAAETAMLLADGALLDRLAAEAGPMLPDPVDQAHLQYLRMRVMVAQQRLADCLATGHTALELLGVPLPRRAGRAQAGTALLWMRQMTRRRSDDELLALARCTVRRVAEAQLVLSTVGAAAYAVAPTLIPLVLRRQLELTFAHGLVPSSPVVLANYALLRVLTGDLTGAQRFGEVAVRMSEGAWFRSARARAVFIHLNFVRHLRHPIRAGLPLLREAYQEALDRGDAENAGLSRPRCSTSRCSPDARLPRSTRSPKPCFRRSAPNVGRTRSAGPSSNCA